MENAMHTPNRDEIHTAYQQGEGAIVQLINQLIQELQTMQDQLQALQDQLNKNSKNSSKPLPAMVSRSRAPKAGESRATKRGSLVIRVTQPDKSCIQRVPLEVKIYALEQMFDV